MAIDERGLIIKYIHIDLRYNSRLHLTIKKHTFAIKYEQLPLTVVKSLTIGPATCLQHTAMLDLRIMFFSFCKNS